MKNVKVLKTKKFSTIVLTTIMAAVILAGCGKKETAEAPAPEVKQEAAEAPAQSTAPAEEEPAEEVTPPFLKDLEMYDDIISTLSPSQYYAFAGIGEDYDALLVADGVFDNGDGTMAAIDAKVYGVGNDGKIYEAGSVWSDGTAYPLAVYENSIMFGGNHHMALACVRDASVIIQREAFETFDEKGNVTYTYNDGNIDDEKTVENDSILSEMYEKYNNAVVINFNNVGGQESPECELGDYPSNWLEDRVHKTSFASYDEIIGLLESEEAYALVDVRGYDGKVLLITNYTYDDLQGHIAAVEVTPYTMKGDNMCTADSLIYSGGTATPLSIDSNGMIFGVTHTEINKYCYGENGTDIKGIMMMAYVHAEDIDDKGNPKSVLGFVRTKNSVIDDDSVELKEDDFEVWRSLLKEYEHAEPISFTRIQ